MATGISTAIPFKKPFSWLAWWSSYWASRNFHPGADASLIVSVLNEALTNHRHVKITEPGTYEINDTIWIPSNTILEFVAGCTFKKTGDASTYTHIFANKGIQTRTSNTNIKFYGNGLILDVNGLDNYSSALVYGCRGQFMFFQVDDFIIDDLYTDSVDVAQFMLHLAEVSNGTISNIDFSGTKDGIHVGVASNLTFTDIVTTVYDDGIALNGHDYPSCNPTVGNITNISITRFTDNFKLLQAGSSCRIMNGSWAIWTTATNYYLGDTVVNGGRIYRSLTAGPVNSANAPTHASGAVTGADGIEWLWTQNGTITEANVDGVTFTDCVTTAVRNFVSMREDNDAFNINIFPGTYGNSSTDNIIIDNLSWNGQEANIIANIGGKIGTVTFKNSTVALGSATRELFACANSGTIEGEFAEVIFDNSTIDVSSSGLLVNCANSALYQCVKVTITDCVINGGNNALLLAYKIGQITLVDISNTTFDGIKYLIANNEAGAAFDVTVDGCSFTNSTYIINCAIANQTINFTSMDSIFNEPVTTLFNSNQVTSVFTIDLSGSSGTVSTTAKVYSANITVAACDLPLPVISSAIIASNETSGDYNKISVLFNITMDATSVPDISCFAITGKTMSAVAIHDNYLILTITGTFAGADSITINYTKPVANYLRSSILGTVASFTGQAVTNNITAYNALIADGSTVAVYDPIKTGGARRDGGGNESIYWDMMYGSTARGAEQNSGVIIRYAVYEITACQVNFFYAGCLVGDVFVCNTVKTCDANNKVKRATGNHLTQPNAAGYFAVNQVFNGTNSFLKTPTFTFAQPEFIIVVLRQITWTNADRFWDGYANNLGHLYQDGGTPTIKVSAGTPSGVNNNLTINKWCIIRELLNHDVAGTSKLQVDATTATTTGTNFGTADMAGFTLGCNGDVTAFANFGFKKAILRNVAPSAGDEAILYNQMKADWELI